MKRKCSNEMQIVTNETVKERIELMSHVRIGIKLKEATFTYTFNVTAIRYVTDVRGFR